MNQDDRDQALNKLLQEWEAPAAPSSLDARVLEDYRRRFVPRVRWNWWAPIAATAVGVIAAAVLWSPRPAPRLVLDSVLTPAPSGHSLVTTVNLSGFRPIPDAKIVVEKTGEKP